MNRGYVNLYRKLLADGWLKDHKTMILLLYCLMRASHKPRKTIIGTEQVELEAGQLVTGRDQVLHYTGLSEQNYRTCLKRLKSRGTITTKATNRYTIITVVNWSTYQNNPDNANEQNNEQTNEQLTSSQRTGNEQVTTNKNYKNYKNRKKKETDHVVFILPEWVPIQEWEAFVEMREGMKVPFTDHAKSLIVAELEKLANMGQAPADVLNQSVANGWRGVFPLKQQENKKNDRSERPNYGNDDSTQKFPGIA